MKNNILLTSVAAFAVAASANATVTFSNIVVSPGALTTPHTVTTIGNSLTLMTPNAIVGPGLPNGIAGLISLQYDVAVTGGGVATLMGWEVDTTIQGFLRDTGTLEFKEDVFELDSMGNEIGYLGGTTRFWTSMSNQSVWKGSIPFSKGATDFRVKKTFYLDAFDDGDLNRDRAVLGLVNQSVEVVPEPASMAALAAGVLALARRRRQK